mmetsp:Transcript_2655/g.3362  ORF Transcript_2655/g.3362 Transcript_2655/m.3362 type:complete len:193 (-) Transcript_2655:441-1019(-)
MIMQNWFCFRTSENLKVFVDDGVTFVNNSKERYDAVILDADTKDITSAIQAPPLSFLTKDFLHHMNAHVLAPGGAVIMNLVSSFFCSIQSLVAAIHKFLLFQCKACVSTSQQSKILNEIKAEFGTTFQLPMNDLGDANSIITAISAVYSDSDSTPTAKTLVAAAKRRSFKVSNSNPNTTPDFSAYVDLIQSY